MKMTFWDAVSCSLLKTDRRFRGAYCLHYQGEDHLIALMMESASTSETLVNFYQVTKPNIPEASYVLDSKDICLE
jgi:hypothetical protein